MHSGRCRTPISSSKQVSAGIWMMKEETFSQGFAVHSKKNEWRYFMIIYFQENLWISTD